jgi:hypothetical protein
VISRDTLIAYDFGWFGSWLFYIGVAGTTGWLYSWIKGWLLPEQDRACEKTEADKDYVELPITADLVQANDE